MSGARQALIAHWHKEQRADLQDLLAEITHDERIMAAAACAADLTLADANARTIPRSSPAPNSGRTSVPPPDAPAAGWTAWSERRAAARAATCT